MKEMHMANNIRKGINIWSFPSGMSLVDCMRLAKKAGFEGIEPALALTGELSLESRDEEIYGYRLAAEEIGIEINSLATGLFWQFSLTANRADIREKAKDIVRRQLDIASILGADCVLVCPGTVGVDFTPGEVVPQTEKIEFFAGSEIIDYDVAYDRALQAFLELAPYAEEKNVTIGIENIWNKFLLSPLEMRDFIDKIHSSHVKVFFDVGNALLFGYPEQWIRILGKRIKKLHFKDYRREAKGLAGFVDLLAGDVDYVSVVAALEQTGYDGWANAEMCPPYKQYSDQIIYNTSSAMDRILHRGA